LDAADAAAAAAPAPCAPLPWEAEGGAGSQGATEGAGQEPDAGADEAGRLRGLLGGLWSAVRGGARPPESAGGDAGAADLGGPGRA